MIGSSYRHEVDMGLTTQMPNITQAVSYCMSKKKNIYHMIQIQILIQITALLNTSLWSVNNNSIIKEIFKWLQSEKSTTPLE